MSSRPPSPPAETGARYEVELDPLNRLILRPRTRHGVPGPRRLRLHGWFSLHGNHRLIYHIHLPDEAPRPPGRSVSADEPWPPFHELELTGRWALTKQHELTLTLEDSQTVVGGSVLRLRGEPLAAEDDALLMAVTTTDRPGVRTTRVLRFEGAWQVDERNALTFDIARQAGPPDTLTFTSAWALGAHHQIQYRFTRWDGVRRSRATRALTFRGTWAVSDHETLRYDLEGGEGAALRITASVESNRLAGETGVMRFRLGAEARFPRTAPRQLIFRGDWTVDQRWGLRFELRYADGRRVALLTGLTYTVRGRTQVAVALSDERKEGLGVEVTFTRRLPRGLQLFLRGVANAEERAIEGGLRIPW